MNNMPHISKAGVNFLKCAFASPDFAVDPGQGIPDNYDGLALMRKDVYTNSVAFTADKDTWVLMMPTPGIAYWTCETAVGAFPQQTTEWTPKFNSSFETLFGTPTDQTAAFPTDPVERSMNVSKFRYASNCLEITPTSNFTQFAGSITVWKLPVSMADGVHNPTAETTAVNKILVGTDGLVRVPPDNKPFKFLDGAYSMAVNTEPEWTFEPILSGVVRVPGAGLDATSNSTFGQFHGDFVGMGHLQSVVMRVSTPASAVNAAIIKTWSCIEYQPNPRSAFYEFAGVSPQLDSAAMKLYRDIALKIPVAVCVRENDGFWQDRVLPLLKGFMKAARYTGAFVPQVGMAVAGVDALAELFAGL